MQCPYRSVVPSTYITPLICLPFLPTPQYRDLIVAKGEFPFNQKENPIPCSDMAGELVALGADVNGWKVGERVCSNFAVDHVYGDVTEQTKATSLGGAIDGVLTEYKVLPAHVRSVC